MTLHNPLFANNARICGAATNAPPMRRGEADRVAVRILQNMMIAVGAGTMRRSIRDGELDGDYGGETERAVQRFQETHQLGGRRRKGDGIAGQRVWEKLDVVAPHGLVPINLTPHMASVTPLAETRETTDTSRTPVLPTPADLEHEYRRFRDVQGRPCAQPITHQCAIRMSVALGHCAPQFHLDNPDLEWTHDGIPGCRQEMPHNAGAHRLLRHLRSLWTFTHYRKGRGGGRLSAAEIHAAVVNRPGIIFFQDLDGGTGDHIDYWDGTHTMNDLLRYNAADERPAGAIFNWDRWFHDAQTHIWFCPLPAR